MGTSNAPVEDTRSDPPDPSQPVSVLWMTSGLGCDGDSFAITAATNPSLEELLRGCFPGMPPVVIYNPVFAYDTGAEFMEAWHRGAAGKLDPFILVLEGSVPNEEINGDGHWAALGTDPETGDPITTCEWLDRLASQAAAVLALGTCAAYGGIPAKPALVGSSGGSAPGARRAWSCARSAPRGDPRRSRGGASRRRCR